MLEEIIDLIEDVDTYTARISIDLTVPEDENNKEKHVRICLDLELDTKGDVISSSNTVHLMKDGSVSKEIENPNLDFSYEFSDIIMSIIEEVKKQVKKELGDN